MNIQDYKKGAEAVATPLNEKLKEMEEALNKGIAEVKSGVKINTAVNQQIINILEEQDSRITDIEKFHNFSLASKENINCLDETSKRVLLGIMYDFIQKFDSNYYQKKYFLNIAKCLRLFEFEKVDIEKIDNIDSMKTQSIMFQVISELAFLDNCSFEFPSEIIDFLNSFMLNNKKKQDIFSKIEDFYNTFGVVAIIDKYESIEVDYQKPKYNPLGLKVKLPYYSSTFSLREFGYNDTEICSKYFDNIHKKYPSGFDNIIERALRPFHQKSLSILYDVNSDDFIGKRIAKKYSDSIITQIGIIQDFLETIPELNIEIKGLSEIKQTCYDKILELCKNQQKSSVRLVPIDFEKYKLAVNPCEDSHLVDSLFGGLKTVTDYSIGLLEILPFEQELERDIKKEEESCAGMVEIDIKNLYINRLNNIVELINSNLPK